jgi:ketosteroid isomerase-like protein
VEEQRLALLRRGYDALSRRDLDAWLEDLAPGVEIHELPEIPDTDIYRGHEGVRRWFEGTAEFVESWRWTLEEVVKESGDTVVVRAHVELVGVLSAVPVEQTVYHVFKFTGSKAASIRGFLTDAEALEASGSTA